MVGSPTMLILRCGLVAAVGAAAAVHDAWVAPPCPACARGRGNVLLLGNQKAAGMSDRETIIGSMGHLAAQLCGRLVAPQPCVSLNGRHGVRLSCRLDWADFFALEDGAGEAVIARGGGDADALEAAARAAPVQLASRSGAEAVAALDAALACVANGTTFAWRFSGVFYGWRDALSDAAKRRRVPWTGRPDWRRYTLPLAPRRGLCEMAMAPRVATLVRRAATLAGAAFDALHLRRTDAAHECPTDPDRDVAPYLDCAATLRRSPLLLLFSDETSERYLARIRGLPQLSAGGRSVADGDALVARAVGNDTLGGRDNGGAVTIYLVGKELQGLASTRFEMSRATCRVTVLGDWADGVAHHTAQECEKTFHGGHDDNTTAATRARLEDAEAAGRTIRYAEGRDVAVVAPALPPAQLLVGILTAAHNAGARRAVRSTWLGYGGDHAHVFVLGLPYGDALERENQTHGDLALVALRDHYTQASSALPLKTAAILWLARDCGASFALKTDDDSFVRLPTLMAPLATRPRLYYGGLNLLSLDGVNGVRHFRHPHFPDYNQGGGYVVSRAALACMLAKTTDHWDMPREDVFAGLLARDCAVDPTPIDGITLCDRKFVRAAGCRLGPATPDADLVAGLAVRHKVGPDDLFALWDKYYGPEATQPAGGAAERVYRRPTS